MKTKHVVILVGVAALVLWGRAAFAKSADAGAAKDVTKGGALGASPINSRNVAQVENPNAQTGAMRRLGAMVLAPSSAFQNPQNRLATDKYKSSGIARLDGPARPDYAFNVRSNYAITPADARKLN